MNKEGFELFKQVINECCDPDYELFCKSLDEKAEFVLAMAKRYESMYPDTPINMMKKKDIINILVTEGELVEDKNGKYVYVDIYDKVMEGNLEMSQVIYYLKSNRICARFLDEMMEEHIIDYDNLSYNSKIAISKKLAR